MPYLEMRGDTGISMCIIFSDDPGITGGQAWSNAAVNDAVYDVIAEELLLWEGERDGVLGNNPSPPPLTQIINSDPAQMISSVGSPLPVLQVTAHDLRISVIVDKGGVTKNFEFMTDVVRNVGSTALTTNQWKAAWKDEAKSAIETQNQHNWWNKHSSQGVDPANFPASGGVGGTIPAFSGLFNFTCGTIAPGIVHCVPGDDE